VFSRPVFLSSRSCRKSLTETYRIKGHISTLAQGHTKSVGKNKTNKKTPKCQKKKTKPKEIKTTIIKTRNIFQFRHSSYVIKSHLLFRHLEKRKRKKTILHVNQKRGSIYLRRTTRRVVRVYICWLYWLVKCSFVPICVVVFHSLSFQFISGACVASKTHIASPRNPEQVRGISMWRYIISVK
jgi:hypothetical protein